jgi:predicted DNA-binding transcriptional regulator AlpA
MGTISNALDSLLNEHEVAGVVGLSVASIRRRRLLRQPPTFVRIGSAIRYRRQDIADWLASLPNTTSTKPRRAKGGGQNQTEVAG